MKLYNTLTRKKQAFKPIKPEVRMYTCGPTVYNFAHIGNLRSYLFADTLKRALQFNKYKVKQVMNITDVGHLTSDEDAGEDKMLKGAKREKKTVQQIAQFYTKSFKEDIKKLNLQPPTIWCKASEHIKEQIDLIEILQKKGYTYFVGGNVYFDTSKLKDYGKLTHLTEKTEARVKADSNKKNPRDFVLWFTKSKFQEQEMKWNSPWGKKGYPGWHIECSAMSMKYLGSQFDIHTGGIDHVPVHHTNELAQSEAATGKKPWVRFWLHNEFLILNRKKMAKSGEGFITLSTLEKKGFHPLDYRYFCLGALYRKQLMFSYEALTNAKKTRKRLMENINILKSTQTSKQTKAPQKFLKKFADEISDDLNTPKGLAVLWEVIKDNKLSKGEKYSLILEFDKVLGLSLTDIKPEKIPKEIKQLAEERLSARKNKEWDKSDKLREKIQKLGYVVGDTKDGYMLTKE